MKKTMAKICAAASAVVALLFVIILLVTVFGGIKQEDFDNNLVKGLFVALGIAFLLPTATELIMLYVNDDSIGEIVLRTDKDGATRTTVSVVKRIAKRTSSLIGGVKLTRCSVVENEFGVRLKISVKVRDKDVFEAENTLRKLLEDAFFGALNFRFHSIEIKMTSVKPKYKPDAEKIKSAVEKEAEILKSEERMIPEQTASNNLTEESSRQETDEESAEERQTEAEVTENINTDTETDDNAQ